MNRKTAAQVNEEMNAAKLKHLQFQEILKELNYVSLEDGRFQIIGSIQSRWQRDNEEELEQDLQTYETLRLQWVLANLSSTVNSAMNIAHLNPPLKSFVGMFKKQSWAPNLGSTQHGVKRSKP